MIDPNEDVHVGLDGWLFLAGGSNSVLDLYRRDSSFTRRHVRAWIRLLNTRRDRVAAAGADYVHLPVPDKLSLLSRFIDGELENPAGGPIRRLAAARGLDAASMIDPSDALGRHDEERPVFWKTDTHWSPWGCYRAYELICARLGLVADPTLLDGPCGEPSLVMDLGGKLTPPARETVRFLRLERNARRVHANPLVRYKEENALVDDGRLHVGSHVVFANDSPHVADRVVVLFGDSFSEYRSHLLTGMLAETVRELHFVWSAGIDHDYVRRVRADAVVTELAERFMTRVPVDDLDIDLLGPARVAAHSAARAAAPTAAQAAEQAAEQTASGATTQTAA